MLETEVQDFCFVDIFNSPIQLIRDYGCNFSGRKSFKF